MTYNSPEYHRNWRKKNPDKVKLASKRKYQKVKSFRNKEEHVLAVKLLRHKLTLDEYQILVNKYQGKCGICGENHVLVIDHCHETGIVRGMLCRNCNSGLGLFQDNPLVLRSAIQYREGVFNGSKN